MNYDPQVVTTDRDRVRARSKQLLGGWYRAEVARAISDLGATEWTLADLEEQLPDVPRSCVNKELATLIECDLVLRGGRNERGQYVHTAAGFPEYWAVGRVLTARVAAVSERATVVSIQQGRRRAPRG
jgi:hypothetical protein